MKSFLRIIKKKKEVEVHDSTMAVRGRKGLRIVSMHTSYEDLLSFLNSWLRIVWCIIIEFLILMKGW